MRDGDHSTLAAVPESTINKAQLIFKDDGIAAGMSLAERIFGHYDPNLEVKFLKKDGDKVKHGDVGLYVEGSARSILTCERLVLNCLQRMSGIATYTNYLNSLIKGTNAKLLDTRKTTPNFRLAEKWAVVIGGGQNHRFGLFDMIMLKDNHIDFCGGIEQAVIAAKNYLTETGKNLRIEVETRNLDEVKEALSANVDVIMLDNMNTSDMKKAVSLIDGACQTEASGGITETTIRKIAECGVDFISVGALTHSLKSLDISLKAI